MSRFLVDYDSTICDTQAPRLEWTNREFDTNYQAADLNSWVMPTAFDPSHYAWMWSADCFLNEEFQYFCPPVEGALEGVHSLLHLGHDAIIVSDRPSELFEVTRDWLDRHGLETVRLLFTRHKHSLNPGKRGLTKVQAAWYYKLDHVIEDSPHNSVSLAQRDYVQKVFLLDMPYNQGIEHEKLKRVSSWKEIRF